MKAAYISGLGGTDRLQVGEVPKPKPSRDEVLIRVRAVGLNWLDVLLRTEDFGLSFPIVPGSDVYGILEEGHERVSMPRGTPVVINPAIPCGQCPGEPQNPNACRFVQILGVHHAGGYGEYVTVPGAQVFRAPDGMPPAVAAAFPLDYLTAWRMLKTKADLKQGEAVFVWGASGSLGTAAVKIAKALGATIYAAAGTERQAEQLGKVGAHYVVNYKTEDVVAWTKLKTHNAGVDCVFESIGAATIRTSMNIVRPHGRIVICGTRSGAEANLNLEDLYYSQISIIGSRMGSRSEFETVLSHIAKDDWAPVVAQTYKLRNIRDAHRELENRHQIGKLVVVHD